MIDSSGIHRPSGQQLHTEGNLQGCAKGRGKTEDTLVPDFHILREQKLYEIVTGHGDGGLGNPALYGAVYIGNSGFFTGRGQNLSALDIGAQALVVSNFTLCASYKKGNRPDYLRAEAPARANELYQYFVNALAEKISKVETGVFGADMETHMITDGPITIVMHSEVLKK